MASPNLSEIVTTTLRARSKKLADNFTHNTALIEKLNERGNKRFISGGRTIVEEIAYDKNRTYKRYSGYEPLNIAPQDVFTAAEFGIKQSAIAVTISGLEELQNSGKEQIIDLLDARISNAEDSMLLELSADMYSDGTADGGKQVNGLQALVADTGLGTVGGISASTWAFWRNYVYDFSVATVTPSATTITTAFEDVWLNTQRNRETTDLIVADNTYFKYYWDSLLAIQRITSTAKGEAGFKALEFMGVPVVPDGAMSGDAPSAHVYFLNTKYLALRPHRNRDMVPLNPDRFSTNQDALVKLIAWAGNLTVRNRRLQGVICA